MDKGIPKVIPVDAGSVTRSGGSQSSKYWAGCPLNLGSDSPSAQNEVQNERNDRKNQQQVDQSASDVKYREAAQPRDQQNNE